MKVQIITFIWGNVTLQEETSADRTFRDFAVFDYFQNFLKLVICESSCPQNTKYKIGHPKKPRNN